MADLTAALRAGGILMPAEMIQAAQLEGIEYAVAATILIKETGGGKNIWGHDTSVTAGTYTPGGTVTKANYLAYRTAMRAGQIKRNGVGPCQATSAQYQDTADALGGCWDPVANMRSGFRGMGALIKAYGVQQGARRYNGSGPAAEAYGRDFLARYNAWKARLAGVSVIPAPAPVPAPAPAPRRDDLVQNFPHLTGTGRLTLGCPVGPGTYNSEAYVSLTVSAGRGHGHAYAQGTGAGVADWEHPESELTVSTVPGQRDTNLSRRSARRVPDGTSVLVVDYDFSAAGADGGTVTLETK